MNITNQDIEQLVKLIGNQGLGFFALYIIYHYLGQLFSIILIARIVSKIIKMVNNWIVGWFDYKQRSDFLSTLSPKEKVEMVKKYPPGGGLWHNIVHAGGHQCSIDPKTGKHTYNE